MGSFDKRRKTFNFGKGQCMRGAYGTSDGQVSRIGFLYGDPLPTTKATVTFTGKTYANCEGTYVRSNDKRGGHFVWDRTDNKRFLFFQGG